MLNAKRILLVLLIVLSCVGCDQVTKAVAVEHLPRDEVLSFAGDVVRLQYVENRGAFLGFGDRLSDGWRAALLVGLVAVVLAALFAHVLTMRRAAPRTVVALSLVCGGGFGNLIDRVSRGGYVVDFLNCGIGGLRTGIFNVADVAITIGVLLLVLGSWPRRAPDPRP